MKKKKKKVAFILIISILVITPLTVLFSRTIFGDKAVDVMEYIVGLSDVLPENSDANGDGRIDVLDVIMLMRSDSSPRLDSLTLSDDRYSLEFNSYTTEYYVELPSGRPVIPLVEAASAGNNVKIAQAFIPDGETSGRATVTVSNEDGERTYTVNFTRKASNGFVLQYDDRYDVSSEPELVGKDGVTYHSTSPDKVSIDENGVIRAAAVTDEPAIVYADHQGSTVWLKTVDRVEKARINLFLITGQSNGQGCYSTSTWSAEGNPSERDIKVAEQHTFIEDIGVSGAVYGFDVFPRSENTQVYSLKNTLYDLNEHKKQGFEPSLGKAFYESSGEKVVFFQSAYSGAPIQSWLDAKRHSEAGTYTSNKYNFYNMTQDAYPLLLASLGDNYEIVRTCNFWWHGGTAMTSNYDYASSNYLSAGSAGYDFALRMTSQQYYDYYMLIHNDMIEDFGLDYDFIVLNRDVKGACSAESVTLQRHTDLVPIRQAQIALAGTNDDILICSRVSDWARTNTSTDTLTYGYGFVGDDNVHYTQIGHNENGKVSGLCAFEQIFGTSDESGAYLDVIATNGRDALTPDDTVTVTVGDVYRSGSIYMPYSAGVGVKWSSSDENVATVDIFGTVKGVSAGTAVITATASNGKFSSFNVKVDPSPAKAGVDYLWDFNDLTSSLDKNDLTLSDYTVAEGAEGNYIIANGILTQSSSLAAKKHPDFILENPVEFDSTRDWYIEWRARLTRSSVLLGNPTPDDGSSTIPGYIYLAYGVNFAGSGAAPYYPFRLLTGNSTITIPYGDYKSANTAMNTWRVEYSSSTGRITLYLKEGNVFAEVGSAAAGTFEFTMGCMFGRFKGGTMGFNGDIDYIRVHTDPGKGKPTVYYWDFANLKSFDGSNDIRVSDYCVEKGTDANYTLSGGIYSVKSGTTSGNRPDFTLNKPITFDSKHSWSVEWRDKKSGSCVIFGSDTPAGETTIQSYIYAAYTANFEGEKAYSLRFNSGEVDVYLPYGDYKSANTSWNTWRLRYAAKTNTLFLEMLENGAFTVVSSKQATDFSLTVDTMFGRFKDASTGFNGSCDYIKIIIEGDDS